MMKSFFKKLAFVMALAMVVSMAAPAGSVFADEVAVSGIAIQDTTEIVPEYTMEKVGATQDFCFIGAPKDWKTTFKWESSDTSVATVDQTGFVTAEAPGTATITITAGADKSYVETVKITVKGDDSFTVKQTAGDTVKLTFADASKATDDVTLYKLFKIGEETTEVAWPAVVTVKDGVATVKAYVAFEDGDTFVVKTANETQAFVAYVGDITDIKVTAVTANNGKTYADENGSYPIEFKVTYLAGDIEFTTDPNGGWMTYEADANDDIYIDATSGLNTYIYKVGASTTVKATYSYYDAEYNVVEIPYEFVLVGYAAPVETFKNVASFTITNQTDKSKVVWGKNDLVVGDEGYYVGLKVGTTVDKNYYVNAPVDKLDAFGTDLGTISFISSDETKLLVAPDGTSIDAIEAGPAYIIVQLTTYDNNNTPITKNVAAYAVNIKAERKATKIVLDKATVTVLTADNNGGELTKAEVKYEVLDQYGEVYTKAGVPSISTSAKISASDPEVSGKDGKGTITIYGSAYANDKVNNVSYLVKLSDTVKTSLNVVPKKPATVKDSTDVVTTGYAVEVNNVDANIKAEKLVNDSNLYAEVKLYTTWSGMKTGYVTNPYVFNDKDYFTKNTVAGIAKDDLVVKVIGPDGFVATGFDKNDFVTTETGLKIKVANVSSGSALQTMKAGTYTVELYKVTNVTPSKTATSQALLATKKVDSATFTVSNTSATLSVKEYGQQLTSSASSIKDAIVEIASFKLGSDDYTVSASDITEVIGVYNADAGKYFVRSIKVNVPINDTGCTFEQTLTIGKTFTVPGLTD